MKKPLPIDDSKGDRLLIIDARNLMFRAAVVRKSMGVKGGDNAIGAFGFLNLLRKVLDDFQPDRCVLVWDSPGVKHPWRVQVYPGYKANRADLDKDMAETVSFVNGQSELFREEFEIHLPVASWIQPGYEADDLIAAITYRECKKANPIIVSNDRDFIQLLDYGSLHIPNDSVFLYTAEVFEKARGFSPSLWPVYRALMGDSADNIRGLPGIGEKTADALVKKYGDLFCLSLLDLEIERDRRIKSALQTVIGNQGDFLKYLKIIDLKLFPDSAYLQKLWAGVWDWETSPELKKDQLRNELSRHGMFSVVRKFDDWIEPFEKLADPIPF